MQTRYLDRYDNTVHRPWPVSPFEYPLTHANSNNPWPLRLRIVATAIGLALGVAALAIGVASYL